MPNDYPVGTFDHEVPDALDASILHELKSAGLACDATSVARADHGRDWWPLSIRDVHEGRVPCWPGVVVYAKSTDDVRTTVNIASRHGLPVSAQGGRSGVEGGAVAPAGGIALDLTGLDRVIALDTDSGIVRVQGGVFGPDLEASLNDAGFTIGHFPQSFGLSTVGGWLACRSAGQYSNRYGKIEDIVRGLRVVLANGDVVDVGGHGPREAVGPDLVQLFVGSEGTLGIITEATLVVRRRPAYEMRAAYSFPSFPEGLKACQRILQRDAHPAVLRLYDESESQRTFEISSCTLIVLDEGERGLVEATMAIVAEECALASPLETAHVATWLEHRNDVSALAGLWEHGIVVDTIEVAGSWAALADMHANVANELKTLPGTLVASVHQSHAYLDGACLYFTFAGKPEGDPVQYYRDAWDLATRAVLRSGGSLSHHHGIGRNRARFAAEALDAAYPLLATIKQTLDPLNIMNPGVMGLGAEPW